MATKKVTNRHSTTEMNLFQFSQLVVHTGMYNNKEKQRRIVNIYVITYMQDPPTSEGNKSLINPSSSLLITSTTICFMRETYPCRKEITFVIWILNSSLNQVTND